MRKPHRALAGRIYSKNTIRRTRPIILAASTAVATLALSDCTRVFAAAPVGFVPYSGGTYSQDFDTLAWQNGTIQNTNNPLTLTNSELSTPASVTYTLPNTVAAPSATPSTYSFSDPTLGTSNTALSTPNTTSTPNPNDPGMDGWWGTAIVANASNATVANRYGATDGSTTTGGQISFGGKTSNNRALGLISTGTTGATSMGVAIENTSASAITQFSLAYTGELWRQQTVQKYLHFGYLITSTNVSSNTSGGGALPTSGTTGDTNLDVKFATGASSGTTGGPIGATQSYSDTITGINWLPNTTLWLTWQTWNDTTGAADATGGAQGVAIDDLKFSLNPLGPTKTTQIDTWAVGTGSGAWETTLTNWTTGTLNTATTYSETRPNSNPDAVVFSDPNAGTVNVTAASVSPSSITVSNTTGTYTFIGNPINGTGALTKTGAGTLVLSPTTTNGYSGGTAINGGLVVVAADTALGAPAGNLSFNGGTLMISAAGFTSARPVVAAVGGGTIVTGANAATFSGSFGGVGPLTQLGSGGLVLTGASSTFTSGTLTLGADLTLSDGTATLTGATAHALGANVKVTANTFFQAAGTLNLGSGTGASLGNGTMVFQASGAALTNSGNGTLNGSSVVLNSNVPVTNPPYPNANAPARGNVTTNGYTPGGFVTIIGGSSTGNTFNLNAPVSGYSDVLVANGPSGGGKGMLNILSPMTYQGTTVIGFNTGGGIKLGVNDGLPANTDVITGGNASNGAGLSTAVGVGTFGTGNLDLAGFNQHLGSLSNGDDYTPGGTLLGQFDIVNSGAGSATLTLAGANTPFNPFSSGNIGGILPAQANVNLVKGGTNTIILDNTQTYTGSTTVEGGTLQIGDANTATGTGTAGLVSSSIALAAIDSSAGTTGTLALVGTSILPSTAVVTATGGPAFTPGLYLSSGGGAAVSQQIAGLLVNGSAGSNTNITVAEANDTLTVGTLTASAGSISIGGPGAVTITGTQSYAVGSTLSVNGGTLNLNSDAGGNVGVALASSSTVLNANTGQHLASLKSSGTGNFNSGSSVVGTGNGLGGGASTTGGIDGTGTLNVTGTANLTAAHIRHGVLNIGSTSTVTIADSASPGNTAATSVLTTLSNTGTIDLKNNDMILTNVTQYANVRTAITNAFHGGAWDQPGITSSSARANASYGLAYAQASTLNGGTTTFDGQSFSDAVLVKYTLVGDTTLKGKVTGGDYSTVVANLNSAGDWVAGNFFYGPKVTGGDYSAVVANLNTTASGNSSGGSGGVIKGSAGAAFTSAPANALRLEVNTVSGDVSILNTAGTPSAMTLYNIFDQAGNQLLIGNPNDSFGSGTGPFTNERFLAVPSSDNNAVAPIPNRSTTNYKLWSVAQDGAAGGGGVGLSEGESSTARGVADTINIPPQYAISFGNIFNVNTPVNQRDLTFEFQTQSSTGAFNGPDYLNAGIDYYTPEPGSVSLLAVGAFGLLARRRRTVEKTSRCT